MRVCRVIPVVLLLATGCIRAGTFVPSPDVPGADQAPAEEADTVPADVGADTGEAVAVDVDEDSGVLVDVPVDEVVDASPEALPDVAEATDLPDNPDTDPGCTPDDATTCCADDANCTGKLAAKGEDRCNPARCRDGRCVVEQADADAPCSDGNACTVGDRCVQGGNHATCAPGVTPLACDDANPCSDDSCAPATGCIHDANTAICAAARCEGSTFLAAAVCSAKACPTQVGEPCDDANPCTDATCDPASGCGQVPHAGSCPSSLPGCFGTCVGADCVLATETLNGLDDDCDGLTDESFDLDHDGVCDDPSCGKAAVDACPTVWTPDNAATTAMCKDWATSGDGWTSSRAIALSQDGAASTWRRTNEPVEIPLWNGIIDDSVVGYWKLDGDALDSSTYGHDGVEMSGTPTTGVFGEAAGARNLDGSGIGVMVSLGDFRANGAISVAAWFKSDAAGQTATLVGQDQTACGIGTRLHVILDGGHIRLSNETMKDSTNDLLGATGNLDDGQWHHVAAVIHGTSQGIFVDGKLDGSSQADASLRPNPCPLALGSYYYVLGCVGCQGGSPTSASRFTGSLDDVMILNRAMTPDEIAAYHDSRRPYGTSLVPGSQFDLDDVRVTETSPEQAEHLVPSEVVGVKPHSDSPCPMPTDDGTWMDRDDLCGVEAYWKLDGDAMDASDGGHFGLVKGASSTRGRFGDPAGAMLFRGNAKADAIEIPADPTPSAVTDFTAETWFRMDAATQNPANRGFLIDTTDAADRGIFLALQGTSDNLRLLFQVRTGPGFTCTANVLAPVVLGRWHHTAFLRRSGGLEVYFDGLPLPVVFDGCAAGTLAREITLLADGSGRIGLTNAACGLAYCDSTYFQDALDDLIIHSVAKSPEYIYRRANPGVPTVRFLAQTNALANEAGTFDFLPYALHWANPAATASPAVLAGLDGLARLGILSPSLGYAGWWRFNEGAGTVAADSSSLKRNGVVIPAASGPSWTSGSEGTSLQFDGTTDRVAVPFDVAGENAELTAEAVVNQDATQTHNARIMAQYAGGGGSGCESGGWALYLTACEGCNEHGAGLAFLDAPFDGFAFPDLCSAFGADAVVDGLPSPVRATFEDGMVKLYGRDGTVADAALFDATILSNGNLFGIGEDYEPCVSDRFKGTIDSVRLMSRPLTPDEFLHYPMASWTAGPILGADGKALHASVPH